MKAGLICGVGVVLLATACSTTRAETPGQAGLERTTTTTATTTTAVADEGSILVEPQLVGEPLVFSAAYPLPGETGHSTAVVFEVRNPSDTDLERVRYRAAVASDDGLTAGSVDSDFSLRAGETRWVVGDVSPKGENSPTTAKVTIYPADPTEQGSLHSDPALWESSNRSIDCNDGFTGCAATADVVFHGDGPQNVRDVIVIIREGELGDGPITFAGTAGQDLTRVLPNQTVPISVRIYPSASQTGGGPIKGEVVVLSAPL